MKPKEIKEAVYHCALYIGLGKAENAVNAVNAVFAEKGIVLRGDRLDNMFDYLPYDYVSGQWQGVRIQEGS